MGIVGFTFLETSITRTIRVRAGFWALAMVFRLVPDILYTAGGNRPASHVFINQLLFRVHRLLAPAQLHFII